MNDTSPEMQRRLRSALLARSGAERVRMGSEMFDTARRPALAALVGRIIESWQKRAKRARPNE